MSHQAHAPRPTEFAGVRFRSKSEAVFARCLSLAGNQWKYEPGTIAGHGWDFIVKRRSSNLESFVFIEYKPSRPTMCYVDSLVERMRKTPVESLIVWGSPWNPAGLPVSCFSYVAYPLFSSDCKYGWGDFMPIADHGDDELPFSHRHDCDEVLGPINRFADDSASHRFDLKIDFDNILYRNLNRFWFDLNPVIKIQGELQTWRRERLEAVAKEAVKRVGLFKIDQIHDDKGELNVRWRNRPNPKCFYEIEYLWEAIGNEPRQNVFHSVVGQGASQ